MKMKKKYFRKKYPDWVIESYERKKQWEKLREKIAKCSFGFCAEDALISVVKEKDSIYISMSFLYGLWKKYVIKKLSIKVPHGWELRFSKYPKLNLRLPLKFSIPTIKERIPKYLKKIIHQTEDTIKFKDGTTFSLKIKGFKRYLNSSIIWKSISHRKIRRILSKAIDFFDEAPLMGYYDGELNKFEMLSFGKYRELHKQPWGSISNYIKVIQGRNKWLRKRYQKLLTIGIKKDIFNKLAYELDKKMRYKFGKLTGRIQKADPYRCQPETIRKIVQS